MRRLKVKKKRKLNKGLLCMLGVVLLLCVILGTQMVGLYSDNKKKQAEEETLLTALEEQKERKEQLEEKKVYVQTKKYIEEVAKGLGYVYPDEIIFKASNQK